MRPLPNKTRIIILTVLTMLFVLITPVLLSYSLGYRLSDIDDVFSIVKTGGVYVHSNISNTEVYLDGKFVKSNGVLARNTLIQNLVPGESYQVEIRKEGYNSWIKNLSVYKGLVTEGRVLMIPQEIPSREILPFLDVEGNATTTPLKNLPVVKGKTVPNNTEYRNLMTLFEGKDIYATSTETVAVTNIGSLLGLSTTTSSTSTVEIPEYFTELGVTDPDELDNLIQNGDEVSWLENGNIVLHWIGKELEIPFYYCLLPEECRQTIRLDWKDNIKKFDFLPGRNDVFLVLIDSGLYAVEVDDRSERNSQAVYTKPVTDFIIGPNGKVIVRNGNIFYELTI